jgi:hypothetical protein
MTRTSRTCLRTVSVVLLLYVVGVGVRSMYVASHCTPCTLEFFLPEYVLIYYRLYVKVLVHVHRHTKTTRTVIITLAGVLLRTSTNNTNT